MNSCDVFFYQTGRVLGVDNLEAFSKSFGFGRPTGIDLPDEVKECRNALERCPVGWFAV